MQRDRFIEEWKCAGVEIIYRLTVDIVSEEQEVGVEEGGYIPRRFAALWT